MTELRMHPATWTRFSPALFACLMACNPDAAVNPPSGNPPGALPGFSILSLLHGTQTGAEDYARDVAVDEMGNVYVTGGTSDRNFHTTTGAYQRTFGRGMASTSTGGGGSWDVFVMKFAPDGQLLWSTLLGGGNYDRAYAIEVDASGVYVAGRAGEGFPTTGGVIQPTFAGDNIGGFYGRQDGFIAKLSLDGTSLLWSTYFGSSAGDFIRDLAVGANGDLYPAVADAKAFPHITPGAFQSTNRGMEDGVVCRLSAGAASVRWCTYIGGTGRDAIAPAVRLDGSGNVFYLQSLYSTNAPTSAGAYQTAFGGTVDMHLSKLSPDGAFLFGTYFGGSGNEGGETHNLWVTPSGEAYLAAHTTSTDLPTGAGALRAQRAGSSDGFVARISQDGRVLLASTYLGGSVGDEVEGMGMDGDGNIVVTGRTTSPDFPGVAGGPQSSAGGDVDGFIAVLPPGLTSVIRATYLGGAGPDMALSVAVDGLRNVIYAGGFTDSANFPTLGSGILTQFAGRDAFVAGWRFR
jgi:hypothetical protein